MADGGLEVTLVHTDEGIELILSGDVDVMTAPCLREWLTIALIGERTGRMALDFAGVDFLDSAGIHVLIDAGRQLRSRGEPLVLRNPRPMPRRVLEITGLTDLIDVR